MSQPFRLHRPATPPCPIVASLPHSGLLIPNAIAATLHERYRRYLPNQDWHLGHLYDFLPRLGITVLEAVYSRYVVDLNRPLRPPWFGSFWRSVVPECTAFGAPLYPTAPSEAEIADRIAQFYSPYHQQLEALLKQMSHQFGQVYLLDLHSFFGPIEDEVCLGNVDGQSCAEWLIATVEAAFCSLGYRVVRNKVFRGGYITQHYGQLPQVEVLQIELRYHSYLRLIELEQEAVPDWQVPEFERAKANLQAVFSQVVDPIKPLYSL